MDDQPLYSLTTMTGRESASTRTVVVGVAELPWRVFVVAVGAFLTGLPVAFLAWLVVGVWAIAVLVAWMAAAMWLLHGRSTPLEVRNYVALLNRQRAVLDQFMLGPVIVEVPHDDWRIIRPGAVPNPALQPPPGRPGTIRDERQSTVSAIFGD